MTALCKSDRAPRASWAWTWAWTPGSPTPSSSTWAKKGSEGIQSQSLIDISVLGDGISLLLNTFLQHLQMRFTELLVVLEDIFFQFFLQELNNIMLTYITPKITHFNLISVNQNRGSYFILK